MKKRVYQYIRYCLAILTLAFMTLWNYITPLWNDDEGWTHMSFNSIVQSSIHDYFYQNGRFLGQVFAKTLVNLPLPLEAPLNAGALVVMTLLIYKLSLTSNDSELSKLLKYIFIILSVFLLTPCFSQTYLWRAGSGNYLWTILLDLLFVNAFLSKNKNPFFFVTLLIIGFLAGTTNENTVGGIIIICAYYLISKRANRKNIWALLSCGIGYAILLLSPGDSLRSHSDNPDFFKLSLIGKIGHNMTPLNNFVTRNLVFEIIIFIVLFSVGLFYAKNKQIVIESLVWFIAGFLVWYVLLISPGTPNEPQTFFGGFILTLVANVKLISNSEQIEKLTCTMLLFLMLFFTFINLSNGFIDAWKTDQAIQQRNEEILTKKAKGIENIEVKPLSFYGKSKYSMFFWQFDITNHPKARANADTAHRFGVRSVYLKSK